jgi:hypothetical protein
MPILALWPKPCRANNLVAWCEILRLLAHCHGLDAVNKRLFNMPNKVICGHFQPVLVLALWLKLQNAT